MPLRLSVGVSKKVGLPEYSSAGAHCDLELELDSGLLADLAAFHERVRDAYVACHQAVNDELARLRGQPMPPDIAHAAPTNGVGHRDGPGARADGPGSKPNGPPARGGGGRDRPPKPATAGQVKA